jgi:hypothetical protein
MTTLEKIVQTMQTIKVPASALSSSCDKKDGKSSCKSSSCKSSGSCKGKKDKKK